MNDAEKLNEFTDENGNLRVGKLTGLEIRAVSLVNEGANGRAVAAMRARNDTTEVEPVANRSGLKVIKRSTESGGEESEAINWIDDGSPDADSTAFGRAQWTEAFRSVGEQMGLEPTEIVRFATDFQGVLTSEFLHRAVRLYGNVLTETVFNIQIENVPDRRAAVVAALDAHRDAVLNLLDGASEFMMSARPTFNGEENMPIDTETQAALDALNTRIEEIQRTSQSHVQVTQRQASVIAEVLRANGLEDNHLSTLLGQFTISGSSATGSQLGDVRQMFSGALGGAVAEAAVSVSNIFRASKPVAVTEEKVNEIVRAAGSGLIKDVLGKVDEIMRGRRGAPRGSKAPAVHNAPDNVVPGTSALAAEMTERFGGE